MCGGGVVVGGDEALETIQLGNCEYFVLHKISFEMMRDDDDANDDE